ncbi:major facilitator superfamily domain-containing protein [Scheffersomyces amazonensis]|uniref:major facilitator superfamily domain-containing protein n=1 Tax=Scheffersomyces amazonensis TaxID=1078765 RepID=UPI00315C986E
MTSKTYDNIAVVLESSKDDVDVEKQELGVADQYSQIPKRRRGLIIFIVTLAGFLGPLAGNIYIPLLPLFQDIYHVSAISINGTVSIFMVTFAFAPLIWASWADFGGRKFLYLISILIFILANILLATVPTKIGALYFLRIVQAFGASSVMSLGAGTVSDIIPPKNRGKFISIFMIGPQLGPIIGPLFSSIGIEDRWRWVFGFLAILGFLVFLIILFLLPETLRCLVGDGSVYQNSSWFTCPQWKQEKIIPDSPKFPKPPKPSVKLLLKSLKYKPVLLCSLNGGILFAAFYGLSVSFSRILKNNYGFSELHVSLSFMCPGASLVAGSLAGGWFSDRMCQRRIKNSQNVLPEHRFSLQLIGILVSMCGMVGYGWCIQRHNHVLAIFIFAFLSGFGMTWVFVSNTTYLTECSDGQPATNVAIGNMMRNLAAAVSSVIIEPLIEKMGYGWCFTGFAFTYIIGIVLVIILLKYGPKWREQYIQNKRTSK